MTKNIFQIEDYDYIGSTIGNAYFSGLSFSQLWECVFEAKTRDQLDAAVSATIKLNEITCNE